MSNIKKHLQCGSCLHLKNEKCFDKPCFDLGKLPQTRSCASYKANHQLIVGNQEQEARLYHLVHALSGMGPSELQALAGLIAETARTRKNGWNFLEKVYIRYRGDSTRNYASNFMLGYVVYADKDSVKIIGESGKTFATYINEKNGNTLYNAKRFAELRKHFKESKQHIDPKITQEDSVLASRRGEIADFDEVVARKKTGKKQVQKASKNDLVSIVSRMQRGMVGRTRATKSRDVVRGDTEINMNS